FDALGDTATARVIPRDRLGAIVANAALSYEVRDSSLAQVGPTGFLRSIAPGLTNVVVRDEETGLATTAELDVHQRITSLSLDVDSIELDALRDSVRLSVSGRDRLGTVVLDVSGRTVYSSSNPLVAYVDSSGVIRSLSNGSA